MPEYAPNPQWSGLKRKFWEFSGSKNTTNESGVELTSDVKKPKASQSRQSQGSRMTLAQQEEFDEMKRIQIQNDSMESILNKENPTEHEEKALNALLKSIVSSAEVGGAQQGGGGSSSRGGPGQSQQQSSSQAEGGGAQQGGGGVNVTSDLTMENLELRLAALTKDDESKKAEVIEIAYELIKKNKELESKLAEKEKEWAHTTQINEALLESLTEENQRLKDQLDSFIEDTLINVFDGAERLKGEVGISSTPLQSILPEGGVEVGVVVGAGGEVVQDLNRSDSANSSTLGQPIVINDDDQGVKGGFIGAFFGKIASGLNSFVEELNPFNAPYIEEETGQDGSLVSREGSLQGRGVEGVGGGGSKQPGAQHYLQESNGNVGGGIKVAGGGVSQTPVSTSSTPPKSLQSTVLVGGGSSSLSSGGGVGGGGLQGGVGVEVVKNGQDEGLLQGGAGVEVVKNDRDEGLLQGGAGVESLKKSASELVKEGPPTGGGVVEEGGGGQSPASTSSTSSIATGDGGQPLASTSSMSLQSTPPTSSASISLVEGVVGSDGLDNSVRVMTDHQVDAKKVYHKDYMGITQGNTGKMRLLFENKKSNLKISCITTNPGVGKDGNGGGRN